MKRHNEGANLPFYPLVTPRPCPCSETPLSVPLVKPLVVCCHREPQVVDKQHQLRLTTIEGDRSSAPGRG